MYPRGCGGSVSTSWLGDAGHFIGRSYRRNEEGCPRSCIRDGSRSSSIALILIYHANERTHNHHDGAEMLNGSDALATVIQAQFPVAAEASECRLSHLIAWKCW